MPKPRKDPYKPRPCRFCKLEFKPTTKNPKNADEQQFCCAAHRKEFWKHGKLPYKKLQLRMEKRMREIVHEELDAVHEQTRITQEKLQRAMDAAPIVPDVPEESATSAYFNDGVLHCKPSRLERMQAIQKARTEPLRVASL
jgi:hypothetical protein